MKQRTRLSILLLAFFVVSFCLFASPAKASAATEGYYTYTVSGGKATITAVDTSISGAITIPSTLGGYPVTSIGAYAFYSCDSLTSLTIPDSVTSIGDGAFYECTSLTSVTIGNSVTSIGGEAFYYCTSLTSVTIPDSVTSIGAYAFRYCYRLTGVTIPDSVTSIDDGAFFDCYSLAGIYVDDANPNYSSDEYGVLFNKDKSELIQAPAGLLGSYRIPDSVTGIGHYAFSDCDSLTSVTIPDSVTSIGACAFYECISLTSVTIPDSVTSIGGSAFAYCYSLTSVTYCGTEARWNQISIGSNNTYLTSASRRYHDFAAGSNVCAICGYRNEVVVASGTCGANLTWTLTDYGTLRISGTGNMTNYSNGTAPWYDHCSSIETVIIEAGVTSIGDYAFRSCTSLTSVTYCGTKAQWNQISIGSYNTRLTSASRRYHDFAAGSNVCTICGYRNEVVVASGTCGANLTWTLTDYGTLRISGTGNMTNYSNGTAPWYDHCSSIETVIIEDGVTSIGYYAFSYCDSLTSVTIGNSVTSIGSSAFRDCYCLTSVTIGNSVTSIGNYAFYSCDSLTSVTIPDSVTAISDYAFSFCESLTSVTVPDSVTSIGNWAFNFCTSLTSVTIGNSVASIGESAFYECYRLAGIYVDDANPNYSSDEYGVLFNKDKSELIQAPGGLFGSYSIPDSVTAISNYAFYNCTSLTSVTIPDSVTTIGSYAFEYCSSLTSVTIPDSVTSICSSAFSGCTTLTSVTIGNSVTAISNYAFYNCTSLTSVTIGNSVTSIGGYAFRYCTSLTSVTIPDSVTAISNYAFSGCTSLTGVTIPGSVTSIGVGAFYFCTSLTSVTIPDRVTSIGSSAFRDCYCLTSVTIGNSVTSIGTYAFNRCTSLTSVTIPNSVTIIGNEAFAYCDRLTSVIYCGTEDQWNQISIGSNNTYLSSATRYYHNWNEAVCETDKVCTICGEVDGQWHHSYDNGTCTACGQLESANWTLTKDAVVDIVLSEDLYIDLNGFDLSGSIALNGFKVYGVDSTTNDYTCDWMGYFNCTDENGNAIVPEALFTMEDAKRYMTIETENGYTFHRFYLGITKISLAPNDTGFGYKAEFYGDEMVQSKIASIGYNLWMTQDVVVSRTTAFKNTLTLRIRNFDVVNYGQTPVNACVTMTLTDGTVIESGTVTYSLRQVVEQLNASAAALDEEKRSAVAAMIANNPTMQSWLVENIYKKS